MSKQEVVVNVGITHVASKPVMVFKGLPPVRLSRVFIDLEGQPSKYIGTFLCMYEGKTMAPTKSVKSLDDMAETLAQALRMGYSNA